MPLWRLVPPYATIPCVSGEVPGTDGRGRASKNAGRADGIAVNWWAHVGEG